MKIREYFSKIADPSDVEFTLEKLAMDMVRPYYVKMGLKLDDPDRLVKEIRSVMEANARKVSARNLMIWGSEDCERILQSIPEGDRIKMVQWLYSCCIKNLSTYGAKSTGAVYYFWKQVLKYWENALGTPGIDRERARWLAYRYQRDVIRPVERLERLMPSEKELEQAVFSVWDDRYRQDHLRVYDDWSNTLPFSILGLMFKQHRTWKFWCAHSHNFTHDEKLALAEPFLRKGWLEVLGPNLALTLDQLYEDPFGIVVRKNL